MPGKKHHSSCEVPSSSSGRTPDCNKLYPFQKGFTWKGVPVERYKRGGDDWSGVARQVLVGPERRGVKFHLRYFELGPGGFSSYETHKHEHVVIAVRGEGKALLSGRKIAMRPLDVLYVKPDAPHRFFNPHDEPFGFFCIVNAERDRPRPVRTKKQRPE